MNKKVIPLQLFAASLSLSAMTGASAANMQEAYDSINHQDLREHIKVLASDEFEGRLPTTKGEELTLDYLTKAFTKLGFQPGNGDSFLQPADMVEITASEDMVLTIGERELAYRTDMVMGTARPSEEESIKDSELVFVGYGIDAPEYGWNDYEGLDVAGKTVVILVNDPGFETEDPNKFNGKAMTYYGRWTYKYEEAGRKGAAGAIIVHETAPASYPWQVVENSWTGPQYHLDGASAPLANVQGWITVEQAQQIFTDAGQDFAQLKEKAKQGPVNQALGLKASVTVKSTVEKRVSNNFIATWPGSKTPDEHIIYTAHWDHLGKDDSKKGDQIYNGAHDNATGTAGMIEIANAYAMLDNRPERSVTFLFTTAEEQGLLGSKFYAENPIIPLDKTVANINMDSLNVLGRTKDVSVVGAGKSEMEAYLEVAAKKQGRTVTPEARPEAGSYYRSDHFNFAKQGVPALYASSGSEPVDEETAKYRKRMGLVVRGCYHQACDQYREGWNLDGAVEDLQLYFDIGYTLANSDAWPQWSKTSEFQRKK